MKWRLSVHGAIVVVAISVASVAVAQPRSNDSATLGQLTTMKVATERTGGFRQSLFTGAANRSVPAMSVANVVTVREAWSRVRGRGAHRSGEVSSTKEQMYLYWRWYLQIVRSNAATRIQLVGCPAQMQTRVPT